jgi:nucleoside-diphosphate-sugar epimerase
VSEDQQCHPTTEYEITKLEAETLALEFGERTGTAVTALRPTDVFGEREDTGRGDSFAALLRAIASGRFMYFGHGAIANYVYAADVADACIAAADRGVRGVIHLSDPCPLSDFINAASSALGAGSPSKRIPKAAAYAVAGALQVAGALTGRKAPLTVNRVRALTSRTMYVSVRIPSEFAWQPRFGYSEGLRRTVAHYRRMGLLS